MDRQKIPSALAQQKRTKRPDLTITVADDDDFTAFFENLLAHGYNEWYFRSGRALRELRKDKRCPFPLHMSLSWLEWRAKFTPAVRRFWEEYTGVHEPKPRKGTDKEKCERLIAEALATLEDTESDPCDLPISNGKPLRPHQVVEQMCQKAVGPTREVAWKYVRLWFLRRKFNAIVWRKHPFTLLTKSDLAHLKQHDRDFYQIVSFASRRLPKIWATGPGSPSVR